MLASQVISLNAPLKGILLLSVGTVTVLQEKSSGAPR